MNFLKLLVALVGVVPFVASFSLNDLQGVPEIEKLKLEFAKYPQLVDLVNRATVRYEEKAVASSEDLLRLRSILRNIQRFIYEFVNSPRFVELAYIGTERVVEMATPVLAVVSMKEIADFVDIVNQDPELQKVVYGDVEGISELVNAVITDQRLAVLQEESERVGEVVLQSARRIRAAFL